MNLKNSYLLITTMSKSKSKYFTLKNVNFENVCSKYGLSNDKPKSKNITNIDDVLTREPEISVSFYEDNKKEYICSVSMLDMNMLPLKTGIKCFWCRQHFDTTPIGCPIKYNNPIIEKSYISHITKGEYYIKENVSHEKLLDIEVGNDKTVVIDGIKTSQSRIPYYITDGIFCSFNCVLAFIKENNHNQLYKESLYLLNSLYYSLIGKHIEKIIPAPSWRLLKEYGGTMNLEAYRNSFNKIEYKYIFNMCPMSSVFRKNQ